MRFWTEKREYGHQIWECPRPASVLMLRGADDGSEDSYITGHGCKEPGEPCSALDSLEEVLDEEVPDD